MLKEEDIKMYRPILDPQKVESALRLAGIHPDDHQSLFEVWEAMFVATHRKWQHEEIAELERAVADHGGVGAR